MSVNLTVLSGNLTADAEPRYTADGKALTKLRLAVSGRKDAEPLFINITCWEKLAESCQRLRKGEPVLVQGQLRANRWTTKEGEKRETIELTAQSVEFLSRGAPHHAEKVDSPPARSGPTFRTTRLPAAGTSAQATLPGAPGSVEGEADPF